MSGEKWNEVMGGMTIPASVDDTSGDTCEVVSGMMIQEAEENTSTGSNTVEREQDYRATVQQVENTSTEKNPEASKQNEEPTTNENEILSPPFVVDLLTQEENSLQPPTEELWATSRPDQWTRVFQARSTEGGMDFYVDQWALREVASSLLRDLTTEESQKSAAKKSGREY